MARDASQAERVGRAMIELLSRYNREVLGPVIARAIEAGASEMQVQNMREAFGTLTRAAQDGAEAYRLGQNEEAARIFAGIGEGLAVFHNELAARLRPEGGPISWLRDRVSETVQEEGETIRDAALDYARATGAGFGAVLVVAVIILALYLKR